MGRRLILPLLTITVSMTGTGAPMATARQQTQMINGNTHHTSYTHPRCRRVVHSCV